LPEVSANIHHNEAPEALSQTKALIGHYALCFLNSRLSKEMLFMQFNPILLLFQQLTWHFDSPHGISRNAVLINPKIWLSG
jgi:hypothetical protein